MSIFNRPLKILVIDNAVYPLSYGYMQEIFGRCLPKRGHNVTWLLMSTDAAMMGESHRFGQTNVVLTLMRNGRSRLSTFINYFYYKPLMARILPDIITSRNIDVIFVRNHVRVGFSAYRICKKNKIPFVYYLGYPFLESHLLAARLGQRKPRIVAEAAALAGIPIRNWVTKKADFVFAMSDYWAEQIIKELGISSARVKSLPAGFDSSIDPEAVDGTKIRKKFNLADHPTLFYMGTITPPRDALILVNILAKVVQHIPEAKLLLLYGHGEEKRVPLLKQKFAEKGVEKNVVFAPPVSYQQVSSYIKASHVGLSPIETIPLYNVSSPYKFTEMLGMGCPVVASDTPDQLYSLKKSKGGLCVPYNATAFAEAAVYILSHPDEARRMGMRGRAFVEKERSYDTLTNRVEKILQNLVANR